MSIGSIIEALAAKHRLNAEQVMCVLDQVLCGRVFQNATNSQFGKVTNEGVVVFRERGVSLLGEPKHPLSRLLIGELEKLLTDAATAVELESWQKLHKQVVHAQVARITPGGNLEVILERTGMFGESISEVVARCDSHNLTHRDRANLRAGDTRYFYVQKVNAIRHGDAPATITIELSRVTPRLTEFLIRKELKGQKVSFRCTKRVVGRKNYIESDGFIPPDAIKAAGRELDERVIVSYRRKGTPKKVLAGVHA